LICAWLAIVAAPNARSRNRDEKHDADHSGQGEPAPQQMVPHGLWFGLTGPPLAQKFPPVHAALLPQGHVPVDVSHHSPAAQQLLPQLGP